MPQTRSKIAGFAFRDVGKGQSHELTLEGCIKTWKRAEMLNHTEEANLRMRHDYLTRHAHMLHEKQKRTIAKIEKSLETTRAYHSLMKDDFKIDNFDTLTWGYKMPDPKKEPERFQRFVYETRIYHSGFTVQALGREVNKRIEEMKSDRINELARTKLMDRMKRHCVVELFDRKKSLTKILEEHRNGDGKMRLREEHRNGDGKMRMREEHRNGDGKMRLREEHRNGDGKMRLREEHRNGDGKMRLRGRQCPPIETRNRTHSSDNNNAFDDIEDQSDDDENKDMV